jgi:hypothetical protein
MTISNSDVQFQSSVSLKSLLIQQKGFNEKNILTIKEFRNDSKKSLKSFSTFI